MTQTCIIAMRQDSLLNRALAGILNTSNPDLQVITSKSKDVDGLLAEVEELKPEIVIIGESTPMAAKDMLGHLLMSHAELRVLVVSEDTNWLHFFHKKDYLLSRQADLMNVIQSDC